jgi:hypothetical protein
MLNQQNVLYIQVNRKKFVRMETDWDKPEFHINIQFLPHSIYISDIKTNTLHFTEPQVLLYCGHNNPPIVSILSQINPVHTFPSYSEDHIILPLVPASPTRSPSSTFPHHSPVSTSLFPVRATLPTHLFLLNLMT